MKRLCLLTVVLLISLTTVSAQQQGEKSIGINAGYGSEIESYKLGVNFKYNFSDQFRVAPSFEYYLERRGLSFWDANADANYLVYVGDGINAYPLAGLTLMRGSSKSFSNTEFGVNLGGGIDFRLVDALDFNIEAKYQILDNWSQFALCLGISYRIW